MNYNNICEYHSHLIQYGLIYVQLVVNDVLYFHADVTFSHSCRACFVPVLTRSISACWPVHLFSNSDVCNRSSAVEPSSFSISALKHDRYYQLETETLAKDRSAVFMHYSNGLIIWPCVWVCACTCILNRIQLSATRFIPGSGQKEFGYYECSKVPKSFFQALHWPLFVGFFFWGDNWFNNISIQPRTRANLLIWNWSKVLND